MLLFGPSWARPCHALAELTFFCVRRMGRDVGAVLCLFCLCGRPLFRPHFPSHPLPLDLQVTPPISTRFQHWSPKLSRAVLCSFSWFCSIVASQLLEKYQSCFG